MEKERLINADIGRELDLPESTVRYYRDRFETFLPMVGQGRQRRYRPEALEVFRVIAGTLRNSGTADEVQDMLNRMFPRNMDSDHEPQQQVAVPQQQPSLQLSGQLAERDEAREKRLEARDQALVATMRRLLEERSHPQSLWQRVFGTRTVQKTS
ncbi:MAG: MerR family transcriptional regulator [Gemmataceae bacterium]